MALGFVAGALKTPILSQTGSSQRMTERPPNPKTGRED